MHYIHHRYIADNMQLNRKSLNVQFYTDQLLAKNKSLEGKMVAWIYTNVRLTVVYPFTKSS